MVYKVVGVTVFPPTDVVLMHFTHYPAPVLLDLVCIHSIPVRVAGYYRYIRIDLFILHSTV